MTDNVQSGGSFSVNYYELDKGHLFERGRLLDHKQNGNAGHRIDNYLLSNGIDFWIEKKKSEIPRPQWNLIKLCWR